MKDQTVRKLWLIMLFLLPLFHSLMRLENLPEMTDYLGWLQQAVAYGLTTYIYYYCAYKYPGTSWLTVSLFVVGLRLAMIFFTSIVWRLVQAPLYDYPYLLKALISFGINLHWVKTLVWFGVELWWWFLCLKMASLNERLKEKAKREQLTNP